MGKKRGGPVGMMQAFMDRSAMAEAKAPLVNAFAAAHGDYDTAGKFGVGRQVMVNRGGTPIARWKAAGLLNEHQEAAIRHCVRLWEIVGGSARLVANLDRTVFGSPGDGHTAEIEARDELHRIKGGFPRKYWDVFENVCRFDEPAGVAGSKLSGNIDSSAERARMIVCMVADMIFDRERLSY